MGRGGADPFFRVCGFLVFVAQEPQTLGNRSALRLLTKTASRWSPSAGRAVWVFWEVR